MADMFDCGRHIRQSWADGSTWQQRWLGMYDPMLSAKEAWVALDCEGKLSDQAFALFERGWMSLDGSGG